MQITYHNIKGTEKPFGYSHVTVVEANKFVFISGQVGTDLNGNLGNGLTEQLKNAFINIGLACEAAEISVKNIAKTTVYIVNWDLSMMQNLIEAREAVKDRYDFNDTAMTLINVGGLFTPEMLVEIEAIAAK